MVTFLEMLQARCFTDALLSHWSKNFIPVFDMADHENKLGRFTEMCFHPRIPDQSASAANFGNKGEKEFSCCIAVCVCHHVCQRY